MSSKHSSVIRTDRCSGLFNGLDATPQLVVVYLRRYFSAVVVNGADRAVLPGETTKSGMEVVDDAHATKHSSGETWRPPKGRPRQVLTGSGGSAIAKGLRRPRSLVDRSTEPPDCRAVLSGVLLGACAALIGYGLALPFD